MARARRSLPGYAGGFSLVEIMVALTLSLLLLGAVFQIFISAKASYRMNTGLARLQETGRFAASLLARDIRMAGYQGCRTLNQVEPNVIVENPPADLNLYDPEHVLIGKNNLAAGDDLVDDQRAVVGTDSLTIRKASSTGADLTGNTDPNNANIQIDGNPAGFEQDDILIITDCADADIFRVTNKPKDSGKVTITHSEKGNKTPKLSKIYGPDAMVMAFESITYYVADSDRTNITGDPIYSLYAQRPDVTPPYDGPEEVELVAGVENMQVLYGVDTDADGSVDDYIDADAVTNFTNALSVRVALLVSSVAPAATQADTATYDLLDETADPADKRDLRKVFTFTATVRNRSLRSTMFN